MFIPTWYRAKIIENQKHGTGELSQLLNSIQKFDQGDDILDFLDINNTSKPGHPSKSITVDLPEWMVKDLETISHRRGVSREAMIKVIIAEKLKEEGE